MYLALEQISLLYLALKILNFLIWHRVKIFFRKWHCRPFKASIRQLTALTRHVSFGSTKMPPVAHLLPRSSRAREASVQAAGEVLHRSLLLLVAGRTLCATVRPAALWANAHTSTRAHAPRHRSHRPAPGPVRHHSGCQARGTH